MNWGTWCKENPVEKTKGKPEALLPPVAPVVAAQQALPVSSSSRARVYSPRGEENLLPGTPGVVLPPAASASAPQREFSGQRWSAWDFYNPVGASAPLGAKASASTSAMEGAWGLGNDHFATVSFGGGPDVVFPADEQAKEMAIREKMDKDV